MPVAYSADVMWSSYTGYLTDTGLRQREVVGKAARKIVRLKISHESLSRNISRDANEILLSLGEGLALFQPII